MRTTYKILLYLFFIFFLSFHVNVQAQPFQDLQNLPKARLGNGEAYIYPDYKLEFADKVTWLYVREGLGYLVSEPLTPIRITKGNIYVSYRGKAYYSKITNYRIKKIMDKYYILIVKAVGKILVPKNICPSKDISSFDGIEIKEFIKNVGTEAVYRVQKIDEYYDKIIAVRKDEYFELIIFAAGLPIFLLR